jgi:hypothetical protein
MRLFCKKIFLLSTFLVLTINAESQVIISLLLGDQLNTGNIEFGLDGGLNISDLKGIENNKEITGFHLGFYFDIKMKGPWLFHTGVIVRSPMGDKDIPSYSTGNLSLDSLFLDGRIDRNLRYFNVPLMIKYTTPSRIYAEAGFQLGLLNKAFDTFTADVNDDKDLTYVNDNKKSYHPLDAGAVAGIGWRIIKGYGMNLGIRYYWGFVDITLDDSGSNVYNQSLYFALGIPIGVAKARKRAEEKSKS